MRITDKLHRVIFAYMMRAGLILGVEGMRDDISNSIQELSNSSGDGSDSGAGSGQEGGAGERSTFDIDPFDKSGQQPAREDGRQPDGRFAPRTPAAPQQQVPQAGAPAQQGQQGTQPLTAAPKPGESRAPLSWKPEEREGWETMAPHHKAAIARRELEVQQALSTTADARRFQQEVTQAIAPYSHILAAENTTPARAIASLFQTAAALRTAPPGQKADLVADMCVQFGVDLRSLDNALNARVNGAQRQENPMDGIAAMLDQRLSPVMQFMQSFQGTQQQQAQQMEQAAINTWNEFANDPSNEFAHDVKDMVADLLMVAAQRGQLLSLQDAYKAATLAHPTISQLVASRQQASGAQRLDAAARRAQEAAASLAQSGGAPSQSSQDEGDGSVRSDLLSSIRTLSQRRA